MRRFIVAIENESGHTLMRLAIDVAHPAKLETEEALAIAGIVDSFLETMGEYRDDMLKKAGKQC